MRIQAAAAGTLILPDCPAVAAKDDGTFQPLVYVTNDEFAMVLVPLARDRLLAGMHGGGSMPSTSRADQALAACAWDCFVAADQAAALEKLIPAIGRQTRMLLRSLIAEAIEKIA